MVAALSEVISVQKTILLDPSNDTRSTVTSLSVAPKGGMIGCGTSDGRVLLVDLKRGKIKQTLQGHEGAIAAISFLKDGIRVVTSSWDRTTRLWLRKGSEEPLVLKHNSEVKALAVAGSAGKGAAGARDGEVKVFSLSSLKCIRNLQTHTSDVSGLAFTEDGKCLITTSWDGECKIWDVSKYEAEQTILSQGERVRSLALSRDDSRIFLGLHSGAILAINREEPTDIAKMEGHEDLVSTLAVSQDGEYLASGGWDRRIIIWRMKNLRKKTKESILTGVTALSWDPKGDHVYSADFSGTVTAWSF
jgi:WD40 repeat protein